MKPLSIKFKTDDRLILTDISWERVFLSLTLKTDYDRPVSFYIGRIAFLRENIKYDSSFDGNTTNIPANLLDEIKIEPSETDGNLYTFRINITIIDGKSFLENGKWYLYTREDNSNMLTLCRITTDLGYRLDDLSRVYNYRHYKYAYVASFSTQCFDSVNIVPVLISKFMIENQHWKNPSAVSDRLTIKGKFRCILKNIKVRILQSLYDILNTLHKKNGRNILLMSETKPFLWGNLKYINERLIERGLNKDFNISQTFRIAVGKNNSAVSWFKTIRLLAKQDFIFVDDYAPIFGFLKLNPHTKLIQVWHAGEGFKSVGYCRFGSNSSPYPASSCHRFYDYAVTGSERLAEVYSEVFGQPLDKVLPLGMARLDGFLDESIMDAKISSFYSEHPDTKGKKIILFCPTFRGENQLQAHYNYDVLDMDRIYEFCGDEYIWAFKMHPFVKKKPPIREEHRDRIIDLTSSKDINDLYYVTDIMITDYSSAYYEYALLKRPILFYTYDREVYEITRGVHKSILETAPGKVCDNFDELMQALENKDYEIEKTIKFNEENFGNYDGHAADRIIDTILLGK